MEQGNFSIELFESAAKDDNGRFWDAHDFMRSLGYETWSSFANVVNKAIASCAQLGVEIQEAFLSSRVLIDGKECASYRLSRFACFLVAMHADSNKPRVQQAKTILAAVAASLVQQQIDDNDLARIETREDLKQSEKVMTAVAANQGLPLDKIAIFKNAGFRGMYNMSLQDLKVKRKIDSNVTPYDLMGLTELAGNLFRTTQTAERLKNERVAGTEAIIRTAEQVGMEVRGMMKKNSGIAPENLQLEQDISSLKKALKGAAKKMKKVDGPKK
jgi:DNA-damage-inducible protein D